MSWAASCRVCEWANPATKTTVAPISVTKIACMRAEERAAVCEVVWVVFIVNSLAVTPDGSVFHLARPVS